MQEVYILSLMNYVSYAPSKLLTLYASLKLGYRIVGNFRMVEIFV